MNRAQRRAAVAGGKPFCPDAGTGTGLGCPNCRRFEVRSHPVDCAQHGKHQVLGSHPVDCAQHGKHQVLACCQCGALYSFVEVETDHYHLPSPEGGLPS